MYTCIVWHFAPLWCSYLLDQLMRYEPVLISDDDDRDDFTDLSASEDETLYSDLWQQVGGGMVQYSISSHDIK